MGACVIHHGESEDVQKELIELLIERYGSIGVEIKDKIMSNITNAMKNINRSMAAGSRCSTLSFEEFLRVLTQKPTVVVRNAFQVFHDMIKKYVGKGRNEYPDDPESIGFVHYDCSQLFIEGADTPFFADRLFANRLINLVESLKRGTQQNKIYIFEGPHGCGKSTFLNNLLKKFEEYTNTEDGLRFETVWRLDRKIFGEDNESGPIQLFEKFFQAQGNTPKDSEDLSKLNPLPDSGDNYIEVPCPSHDNPILIIPKDYRRAFFDDMFKNDKIKWRLFTEKEYEWVFRDHPCTICSSLFQALSNRLKNPMKVFNMIYARPYTFNRRIGEGISVFNPGDKPLKQDIYKNDILQGRINHLLKDSNQVNYYFSRYAKTNNGIYALMDIKSYNKDRLIELHNIVSEGIHKVGDIEENVNSLFLALMNPEDKSKLKDFQSFSDRIESINIPYVLDLNTEVEIYRNIFGKHIDDSFLPRVLHNFARIIISSRLNIKSEALLEWIGDPEKYGQYCDENLQLLKMEIYTGYIPPWLSDEDRKTFTAKRRRKIIAESESEGTHGFSGRDSIKIFNDFYSTYAREDKLINMSILNGFFTKYRKELNKYIPKGFLESLLRMYNYTILQEVKESLYLYNDEQISRDIQNYLFSINFETGSNETCSFTGEKLKITEEFFMTIESCLLGPKADRTQRMDFRKDTQNEYASKTLTQEIMLDGKHITQTALYRSLHHRYVYNLKEKVLDPFLKNENFRRAIKDYNKEAFKTYDKRIRDEVEYLIKNLRKKYFYTEQGAKQVCMYAIDMDLAKTFSNP
jgi:predicted Ser/Thr protein kinase